MSKLESYLHTAKRMQEDPNFYLQGLSLLQEDYSNFNKQAAQSNKLQISPLLDELVHAPQYRNFLLALADYFDLWLHVGQELEKIVAELENDPGDDDEAGVEEFARFIRNGAGYNDERIKALDAAAKSKSDGFVKRILHEAAHPLEAYKRKWRRIHDMLRKRSPVAELKDAMVVLGRAYYAIVSWYSEKALAAVSLTSTRPTSLTNATPASTPSSFIAVGRSLINTRKFMDPAQALERENAFWEPFYQTCERAVILQYAELLRLPLYVEMSRLFRTPAFSEYARTRYFRQVALYRNNLKLERSLTAGEVKPPGVGISDGARTNNSGSSSTSGSGVPSPSTLSNSPSHAKPASTTNSQGSAATGGTRSGQEHGANSNQAASATPGAYDMISRFRTEMPTFTQTVSYSDARAIGAAAAAVAAAATGNYRSENSVSTLQAPGVAVATASAAAAIAAGSSSFAMSKSRPPISAQSICAIDLHVFLGDVVTPPTELWREGVGVGCVIPSSAFGGDVKSMAGRRRRVTNTTASTRSPLITAVLPSRLTRKEKYSSPLASISASEEYKHAALVAATGRLRDAGATTNANSETTTLPSASARTWRRKHEQEALQRRQRTLDEYLSSLVKRMGQQWENTATLRLPTTSNISPRGPMASSLPDSKLSSISETDQSDRAAQAESFEELHARTASLLPPSTPMHFAVDGIQGQEPLLDAMGLRTVSELE